MKNAMQKRVRAVGTEKPSRTVFAVMQMITIRIIFPIAHLRNSQYSYLWGLRKDLRMPGVQRRVAGLRTMCL
jgi:hypothetical protein